MILAEEGATACEELKEAFDIKGLPPYNTFGQSEPPFTPPATEIISEMLNLCFTIVRSIEFGLGKINTIIIN